MKICYVTNCRGEGDRIFLLKFLENRYEIHVVSITKDLIPEANRIPGVRYHELCLHQKFFEHRLKCLNPLWYLAGPRFLRSVIEEIRPDVLHAGNVNNTGLFAAMTGFHPFLLMPWGSDVLIVPKQIPVFRLINSYAVKRADLITVDSEFVKNVIAGSYNYDPSRIVVFPWGVDIRSFNPERPSDLKAHFGWEGKQVIICIRSHSRIYGIDVLLDAIPAVLRTAPDARFLLIGDGRLTESFRKKAQKMGIQENVRFVGRVRNSQIPYYLTGSDIYVSPSLSDGTSISLLEAMACGLPVVVTDVDANFEWVKDGHNGLIC
jgi:glycosyltransferase involved in cell wall biosynthesis